MQPLFGQSYGAKDDKELKSYFRDGLIINILLLFVGGHICRLFGATPETVDFALKAMPMYAWGFVVMSLNVMISAYLYSTKRSKQAIIINLLRSLIVNSAVIILLPTLFPNALGGNIIWFSFGIYELIVLAVAVSLLKHSERNGIVYE